MQIMAKELLLRIVDRNPVNEGGRYDIHDVLHEESLPSKTAAGTPSNFKESSFYHRLTDMDAVTYKIQEDCDDLEAVKQKIQRAASLVPEYKADVLWSGFPGSRNSSPDIAALEKRALNEGMPLMRFAVGFKEGACVHYPAVSCFPENYDVRKRFWYTSAMAAKENTLIWSKPYYDIMPDTGLMITCSMPLIYNKHRYGAFSIDFSIKSAGRTNILKDEMLPYIMEKAVIDSEGNILLSTLPEHIPDFVGDQPENVLQKKMFHSREMLENVKHGRTGKFSCVEQGRPVIYLFIRLSSLDWIYIEKIDYIK